MVRRPLRFRSEVKQIVHRMPEILLATEIAFRRLHGGVAEQELNLFDFAAAGMAQLRARSAQVVRCNML